MHIYIYVYIYIHMYIYIYIPTLYIVYGSIWEFSQNRVPASLVFIWVPHHLLDLKRDHNLENCADGAP